MSEIKIMDIGISNISNGIKIEGCRIPKTVYIDLQDVDKPIAVFNGPDMKNRTQLPPMDEIGWTWGDVVRYMKESFPDYVLSDIRWER